MTIRTIWRRLSWPLIVGALIAPFTTHCALVMPAIGAAGKMARSCPDTDNAEALDQFDFAGQFSLPVDVASKVKTSVEAAVEMTAIASQINAGLLDACGGIAKDLGDATAYPSGHAACEGAMKAIADTKAKLGKTASLDLEIGAPQCGVDVTAYGNCAARCDAKVTPGSASFQCEGSLQGTCSGQCKGDCQLAASASCGGECSGACEESVSGTCGGACKGTCDGKATPTGGGAKCAGKCEGKCSSRVKGACGGDCSGSCQMSDGASCAGTCTGDCSVSMSAPRCTGTVKPPAMSASCKAKCEAQIQAKASCTPPHVWIKISGAADELAAARLRDTIEKNMPAILDVGRGIAQNVTQIADDVTTVVGLVPGVVQAAMADKVAATKLLSCVALPVKDGAAAAASAGADVKVSVALQASVTAS